MKIVKIKKGKKMVSVDYHANVLATYQPRIKSTKNIDGQLFYVDSDGKLYKAELFDTMFKVTRGTVEHYTYKGTNHNPSLR